MNQHLHWYLHLLELGLLEAVYLSGQTLNLDWRDPDFVRGPYTVVAFPFWHKLNEFLFCRMFEKLFIICVEVLTKSKVQLSGFEP
jgi:hypothetical protein